MWPLLGRTVLESLRVLDWAQAVLGVAGEVRAGGLSMGGDVSVALAGIDDRVTHVAACVATPDWTRPGMTSLDRPDDVLDQGVGDRYAEWIRARLDPMLHLDRYRRGPVIAFDCADLDTNVPADGAERFKAALAARHPAAAARVTVTRRPGLGHLDGARDARLLEACVGRLTSAGGG